MASGGEWTQSEPRPLGSVRSPPQFERSLTVAALPEVLLPSGHLPAHRFPDIAEEGGDVGRLLRAHQHAPAVAQGIFQFAGNYRDISGNDHGAVAHAFVGLHLAEGFGQAVARKLAG